MDNEPGYAWAAGFLDGEGCFSIAGTGFGSGGLMIVIAAGQTRMEPLLRLQELFGGKIYTAGHPKKSTHRQAYIWRVASRTAAECLNKIQRYLVLKGTQTQLMLEFQDTMRGRGQRYPFPQEVLERRLMIKQQVSVLNKRGPEI